MTPCLSGRILALAGALCAASWAPAQQPDRVRGDETVADLRRGADEADRSRPASGLAGISQVLGAVVIVVGIGAAGLWAWRRVSPRIGGPTSGLVGVVARTAISPRHAICLVRIGARRVIVVGVSGDRMSTLGEIDDAEEIAALELDGAAGGEARG